MLFEWICNTKSESDLLLYTRNHLWNLCSSVVNLQRLLCNQKLVWSNCIKAFWYTNIFLYKIFFEKTIIFKAINSCCVARKFYSLDMYLSYFSQQIWRLFICICTSKTLKSASKTYFSVHNSQLNLRGQVESSRGILCSRNTDVKFGY